MSENGVKRSYTGPIMLILLVVMMTLLIIVYSKLLLSDQKLKTDEGQRLSEGYKISLIFAESLHEGTELLLAHDSGEGRLRAAKLIGKASLSANETKEILIEAAQQSSANTSESITGSINDAMNALIGDGGLLLTVTEQEGPVNEEDEAVLSQIRDVAIRMEQALKRFRPPSGEAGYRDMRVEENWILAANDAVQELLTAAEALRR